MNLLVIGRQVHTDFGGNIDVLAIDAEGHVHVLELKRDRTPRDIVAQILGYGSWAQNVTLSDAAAIFAEQNAGEFDEAFADAFGSPLPDLFNADQQLTIVASELDSASDRIVEYLAERYAVPINAVFFRHFVDGDAEYLARTWLIPPDQAETRPAGARRSTGSVRPWNGRDFYVVLGNVEQGSHRWDAARTYGFVGAGGGSWYWKPLRNLAPGKRVFAYVGGAGYVGVGEVTGNMVPLRDLTTQVDDTTVKVIDQPDMSPIMAERAVSEDEEVTEFAVPVRWLEQRPVDQAVMERGLFASQVTVCKLRDERTLEVVQDAFSVDSDGGQPKGSAAPADLPAG